MQQLPQNVTKEALRKFMQKVQHARETYFKKMNTLFKRIEERKLAEVRKGLNNK